MKKKQPGGLKEIWRKFLVALKRRPSMIPLAVIVAAFLVYSLNLMYVSDTTSLIQGANMGLAGFATMLFSMLSFLVFTAARHNTFPVCSRKLRHNFRRLAFQQRKVQRCNVGGYRNVGIVGIERCHAVRFGIVRGYGIRAFAAGTPEQDKQQETSPSLGFLFQYIYK